MSKPVKETKNLEHYIYDFWRYGFNEDGSENSTTIYCKLFDMDKIDLLDFIEHVNLFVPENKDILLKLLKNYLIKCQFDKQLEEINKNKCRCDNGNCNI